MATKLKMGITPFNELHKVFDLDEKTFESKKARLFPSGSTEQEPATVSIFLSSLAAVKEYREELLLQIGINKIKSRNVNLHVYTEVQGGNDNGRPDGLLVITSGKTKPVVEWIGFVEAKIGNNKLEAPQLEKYSELAKSLDIQDIITISNDLVTNPFSSPITCNRNKRNFYHWSWSYLKVTAQRLINTNKIEDEDHVFILKELRKFFDNHKKLNHFTDMGKDWKESASIIGNSSDFSKKIKNDTIDKVVPSLIQEEKDISLHLTDNTEFLIELNAKEDRYEKIKEMIQENRKVVSEYYINGDKNLKFKVGIDFVLQEIRCSTQIKIDNGKAQAQTSTLIKMFEANAGSQENIYVNAIYPRNKSIEHDTITLSQLAKEKEDKVNLYSILDKQLGESIKYFEIRTRDRINKKFLGRQTFISDMESIIERFFDQVMRNALK